jgi:hypothetical protein
MENHLVPFRWHMLHHSCFKEMGDDLWSNTWNPNKIGDATSNTLNDDSPLGFWIFENQSKFEQKII